MQIGIAALLLYVQPRQREEKKNGIVVLSCFEFQRESKNGQGFSL